MDFAERLTQKLGPLPVWVWGVAGAGVVVSVARFRKPKAGTAITAEAQDQTMSDGYPGGGTGTAVDLGATGGGLVSPGQIGVTGSADTTTKAPAVQTKTTTTNAVGQVTKKPVIPGTVRAGSRGATVKQAQTLLEREGYNVGPIDAVFGSQTTKAVKAYQKSRGLTVDGVVGPETWAALLAGKKARLTPARPATGQTTRRPATGQTTPVPMTPGKIQKILPPVTGLGAGGFTQQDRDKAAGRQPSVSTPTETPHWTDTFWGQIDAWQEGQI